ncbi:hypothetical protein WQ57_15130 [Mesobacillus campisalis]|uniref:Uncharacterized protein n=1 Tax=Mesobacillus campisalis TaxID=1408103 RepID=A0A0M2SWD4_9BACI|nr:hypothetical protein [Mesobacillus campisalis]KKK37282.1 hypothetical protein WQ57_15130 [Mesobacillus campisalis]
MKQKSIWKTSIMIIGIIGVIAGAYYGYYSLKTGEKMEKSGEGTAATETVAQFKDDGEVNGYNSVGDFIDHYHKEYNDSLGWGGIDTVDWPEQKKIAEEILGVMTEVETDHPALQKDLKQIQGYAQAVESGAKDKQTLLKLHRYFHDLDVEFNDYRETRDYYDVTEYKRKN